MRPLYYRLIGQTPVPCNSLEEFGEAFGEDRRVAQTQVGPFLVSTVFLGLDHNFWADGDPVLFETMTFAETEHGGNEEDGRECTWLDAEARHRRAVAYCARFLAEPGDPVVDLVRETVDVQEGPSEG